MGNKIPKIPKLNSIYFFYSILNLKQKSDQFILYLQKVEKQLLGFPEWKELGLSFLQKWSTHFLPRPLTFLIFQKLFKRYPIHFNYMYTQLPFPNISLWGHTVDEFTFWRSTHSDFCKKQI